MKYKFYINQEYYNSPIVFLIINEGIEHTIGVLRSMLFNGRYDIDSFRKFIPIIETYLKDFNKRVLCNKNYSKYTTIKKIDYDIISNSYHSFINEVISNNNIEFTRIYNYDTPTK